MLNPLRTRQRCLNGFRLNGTLTSLSLGVVLLTFMEMPAEARPVVVQTQPCTTAVIGSPIPSPVPRNPITGEFCSTRTTTTIITPGRGTIQNSVLINPTVVNSTISDSVLIDPVIVNSTRRVIRRSPVIRNSPGVNIRVRL